MDRKVIQGILAEISMRAKILKSKLKDDPSSVEDVLRKLELLEDEFMALFGFFVDNRRR